jgi:CheY-like chemotaxis protein
MKTVLLVDDEPAVRRLLEVTLGNGTRNRFVHAENGAEAIQKARTEPVDLAVLDVGMPGADGFAVCEALKSLPRERRPRVVMLTAHNSQADQARGRAAGADSYFAKPFSPLSLLDCVERMLGAEHAASTA